LAHSYRSDSTFPVSADNFVIKQSFDGSLPAEDQPAEALIKAAHWNHYFGACQNIEAYLLNTAQYGNPILGTNNPASSFGTDVLLGSTTYTGTVTGTTSFTLTVPSAYGNTPFADHGFSLGHTIYIKPTSVTAANVKGYWANRNQAFDPFFDLVDDTYAYGSVEPVSGRVYKYHVVLKNLIPTSIRTQAWIDNLTDMALAQWRTDFGGKSSNSFYKESSDGPLFIVSQRITGGAAWTYKATKLNASTDSEIIIKDFNLYDPSTGVTEITNRGGIAVKMSGTPNSASFYGLSIGDYVGGNFPASGATARIFRVSSWNIASSGGTVATSADWSYVNPSEPGCSGSASAITPFINLTPVRSNYIKLKIVSSTITLASSVNGSTWTDIVAVTDPSTAVSGPGYAGVWSAYVPNGQDRRWLTINSNSSAITARNLAVADTQFDINLRLMYCKIGPSGLITFTNTTSST